MYSIITQRIKITTNELKELPPLIGGLLVLSSFAIDEIMQLHKLQIGALPNRATDHDIASAMALIQQNAILRNLNTKLYEYDNTLKDLQAKSRLQSLTDLSQFLAGFSNDLKSIRKGVGFEMAKYIRNKFASHFSIADALDALAARDSNDVHYLLPDHMRGNSYHPLGEEVLFLSVFDSADLKTDKMPLRDSTNAWIEWINQSSALFQEIHEKFLIFVMQKYFPRKGYQRVFVKLDRDRQVGTIGKTTIPVWWTKSEE